MIRNYYKIKETPNEEVKTNDHRKHRSFGENKIRGYRVTC
jgi:hypothetical protein